MERLDKIRNFFTSCGGLVRTSDLAEGKIYYNDIKKLIEQGLIEKVRYGYYQWVSDTQESDEVRLIRYLIPDGILCMNTALFHYRYIDRIPGEWHIAVGKDSTKSRFRVEYPRFKPYYIKPEFLEVGLTLGEMNGETIRIYDKERLICDVLKRFSRMDRELFNKSVQSYIADSEKSIARLMDYAKVFKVEKRVKEIVGVWL